MRKPKIKRIEAVLILFIKDKQFNPITEKWKEGEVLLGEKINGSVSGWVMPPGGHVEDFDIGFTSAGHREGFEETGLKALGSYEIAQIRVRIKSKRRTITVHVISCYDWAGNLKNKSKEFKWLKFIPISKIPWEKFPKGEEVWFKRALNGKKSLVTTLCGKNRKDIITTRTRTMA
jgi:8-oxo-dGTP pyrophosphatase MutT (NUDIX family)